MEIERKFLVSQVAESRLQLDGVRIRQGYLSVEPNATEVRIREKAGKCTMTVKSGRGLARSEVEIDISAEQFDVLWPATAGRRIVKRRSTLGLDGFLLEIDVYEGPLLGLCVVEIEFDTETQALEYAQPVWFGKEVTDDVSYKNASLAMSGTVPGASIG